MWGVDLSQDDIEDPDASVWMNIRGPASALIATMESIGWQMNAPHICTTDTGITLNLKNNDQR